MRVQENVFNAMDEDEKKVYLAECAAKILTLPGMDTRPTIRCEITETKVGSMSIMFYGEKVTSLPPDTHNEMILMKFLGDRMINFEQYGLQILMFKSEFFEFLASPIEVLGSRCSDGGKCHHQCEKECFRTDGCVPLSSSGLSDDWSKGDSELSRPISKRPETHPGARTIILDIWPVEKMGSMKHPITDEEVKGALKYLIEAGYDVKISWDDAPK